MTLQRMAKSLAERNWGTALAENLIVVIGILIGLQVDDWNQARRDRKDEAAFLFSLHEDLLRVDELSRRLRHRRVERAELTLGVGEVLFGRVDRDALSDLECTTIVWTTAFNISAMGLPSVDELIGTGRMSIIRDTDL